MNIVYVPKAYVTDKQLLTSLRKFLCTICHPKKQPDRSYSKDSSSNGDATSISCVIGMYFIIVVNNPATLLKNIKKGLLPKILTGFG